MQASALLLLLLALAGCVEAERRGPAVASVPRDARGEPIFAAVVPQPQQAGETAAQSDPAAALVAEPAKIESCAHRRRCP